MTGWYRHRAPLKVKLAIAFALFDLPTIANLWAAARGAARLDVTASSSDAAMAAAVQADTALGLGLLACAALLALSVGLIRVIANPYRDLTVRLEALAAGDLYGPTPFTDQRDCAGRLARAMKAVAAATAAAVEEAGNQRAAAAGARLRLEEARLAAEHDQRMIMASLAQGLAALAAAKRGQGLVEPSAQPAPAPVKARPVLAVDNGPAPPMSAFAHAPDDAGLDLREAVARRHAPDAHPTLAAALGSPLRREPASQSAASL